MASERSGAARASEGSRSARFHVSRAGRSCTVVSVIVTLVTQSFRTLAALSRRNFGQTSALNGTCSISVMIRSIDRPIGK